MLLNCVDKRMHFLRATVKPCHPISPTITLRDLVLRYLITGSGKATVPARIIFYRLSSSSAHRWHVRLILQIRALSAQQCFAICAQKQEYFDHLQRQSFCTVRVNTTLSWRSTILLCRHRPLCWPRVSASACSAGRFPNYHS